MKEKEKLIVILYRAIQAYIANLEAKNHEWSEIWLERIEKINKLLPSGSGIDSGCKIDTARSRENKIVINFSYHHMNENGYYDGWTNHKIIVTPTFSGIDIKITGKDRNFLKDYLYDTFYNCLNTEHERSLLW